MPAHRARTQTHLSRTHSCACAQTHTHTQSKQWDKLRQNILRPMQAPPLPQAELRQQGCTAPVCLASSSVTSSQLRIVTQRN